MAAQEEATKSALEERLSSLQGEALSPPAPAIAKLVASANTAAAAIQINEADARKLIDEQLIAAGWTADSSTIKYAKGARPQKNKNMAIAEWPTDTSPTDYVLAILTGGLYQRVCCT